MRRFFLLFLVWALYCEDVFVFPRPLSLRTRLQQRIFSLFFLCSVSRFIAFVFIDLGFSRMHPTVYVCDILLTIFHKLLVQLSPRAFFFFPLSLNSLGENKKFIHPCLSSSSPIHSASLFIDTAVSVLSFVLTSSSRGILLMSFAVHPFIHG